MIFERFATVGRALRGLPGAVQSRDLFLHDGRTMRRVHVSSRTQIAGIGTGAAAIALSAVAVFNIAFSTSSEVAVDRMSGKVATMEREMASIRQLAQTHAQRLDARQAMLDAVLTGKGDVRAIPASVAPASRQAADVVAPMLSAEDRQNDIATRLKDVTDAKYRETASVLGKVGIDPRRFAQVRGAMGGPYEPVEPGATQPQSDTQFRALFQSWKRLETLQQGIVAIPSARPVEAMVFTSGFGVRSDPFRGGAAMHAGVDIPGPIGTPIYATADGMIGRAGWANGYGNLVEVEHGRGIQTRYGHLSAILVQPGTRITRGQLIGRMGSTGRSTGSHLHYEVRLDGRAVNPMPFLQSSTYLAAMQTRGKTAMGGPAQ